MCLCLVIPRSQVGQESLILVSDADVLASTNAVRVKRQSRLRTGINQTGDLRLIRIVKIRKCSTRADHVIQRVLIAEARVPELLR